MAREEKKPLEKHFEGVEELLNDVINLAAT
jgi:hypothetical protein